MSPYGVAAVEILLDVSLFHSRQQVGPSKPLPIDNEWLASSAGEIQSLAKSIFDDEKQDSQLRSLCLQFIPLDQPAMALDVKRVYSHTSSEELRFAIEFASLEVSDAFYDGLNPPTGPVAGIVVAAPQRGCAPATGDNIAFLEKYHGRNDFAPTGGDGLARFVLTNLRTRQRFFPKVNVLSEWSSAFTGETTFELSQPLDFPVGDYMLAAEFSSKGEVIGVGHKLLVVIRDTPTGKRLSRQ